MTVKKGRKTALSRLLVAVAVLALMVAPTGSVAADEETSPTETAADYDHIGNWIVSGTIVTGRSTNRAQGIEIYADIPRLYFEDTSTVDERSWTLFGERDAFSLLDSHDNFKPLVIERETMEVGIGRFRGDHVPQASLHLKDDRPIIMIEKVNGGQKWEIRTDDDDFNVRDAIGGTYPFFVRPGAPTASLNVGSTGRVGVGIFARNAAAPLHVVTHDADPSSGVRADNVSATVDNRVMFEVNNNGAPIFRFRNTDNNHVWDFRQAGVGNFAMNANGAGPEFLLRRDGSLEIGPHGFVHFDLDRLGNLEIAGDLTVGGTCFGCDGLDGSADVLDRLSALEQENQELRALVAGLVARLEALEQG